MADTTDLKVGMTIAVPRGADYARRTSYRLTITEVASVADGMACLYGVRGRASGAESTRADARTFAVLDVSKIEIIEAA